MRGSTGTAVADEGSKREYRRRQRDSEPDAGAVATSRKGLLFVRPQRCRLVPVGDLEQEILIGHDANCCCGRQHVIGLCAMTERCSWCKRCLC